MSEKENESNRESLDNRVKKWLSKEGYPTEFQTAKILRNQGYAVTQGLHVPDVERDKMREIDVITNCDEHMGNFLLRINHVFECKKPSKPWVIFTSPYSRMASSGAIAQAPSSLGAEALLWVLAGSEYVQGLDIFKAWTRPGFNAREFQSSGSDACYNALQSLCDLVTSITEIHNMQFSDEGEILYSSVVAFPVLVLNSPLFEAFFSVEDGDMRVQRAGHIRCYWQGSYKRRFITPVDIVTLEELPRFAAIRHKETHELLSVMRYVHNEVQTFEKSGNIDAVDIPETSRGIIGAPRLFQNIMRKHENHLTNGG
ncbi:hypothetical protein [Rhodovibrio sodomensis]|uniref:hypothetical protein n=1 Tax=Rhodovibrio sodomensis TaxID=1088 RepID=UPI001908BD2B|nr:hypothetical protein [Rhodovibrio sodomensis]